MNNLSSEDRKSIQQNVRGLKIKILWKITGTKFRQS